MLALMRFQTPACPYHTLLRATIICTLWGKVFSGPSGFGTELNTWWVDSESARHTIIIPSREALANNLSGRNQHMLWLFYRANWDTIWLILYCSNGLCLHDTVYTSSFIYKSCKEINTWEILDQHSCIKWYLRFEHTTNDVHIITTITDRIEY